MLNADEVMSLVSPTILLLQFKLCGATCNARVEVSPQATVDFPRGGEAR